MITSLLVAVARNGVIGRDNRLPWRLPEDLKFFKRVSMGKPMVMGRRTWQSIGRPLPGRTNIVITRNPAGVPDDGIEVVSSLDDAMDLCEEIGRRDGVDEAIIIGGAEVFRDSLRFADRIYFTEVHAEVPGDVYFPDFERDDWKEISRDHRKAKGDEPFDYSFVVLERKENP